MRSLSYWFLFALLLAVFIHILAILLIPRFQMAHLSDDIAAIFPENELTRLLDQNLRAAPALKNFDPNFDYAVCRFNVSETAMEIALQVKSIPTEIIIYNDRLKPIYSTNDKSRRENILRVLIVSDKHIIRLREELPQTVQNAQFFKADTPTGLAVIRLFSARQSLSAEIDAIFDNAKCDPFTQGNLQQ